MEPAVHECQSPCAQPTTYGSVTARKDAHGRILCDTPVQQSYDGARSLNRAQPYVGTLDSFTSSSERVEVMSLASPHMHRADVSDLSGGKQSSGCGGRCSCCSSLVYVAVCAAAHADASSNAAVRTMWPGSRTTPARLRGRWSSASRRWSGCPPRTRRTCR